ncbi:hypothetical protein E4T56_gene14693 [Termitomyces sp. T112]|nr:hypothetical protein E4T56_gene14693 [Termitomyces sp. T112]
MAQRLSSRRGSVCAADPLGTHATRTHNVHASSTLTIVRLPSPPPHPRRPDRVSFATSSFRPPSPSSPRLRPASPHSLPAVPHLSPDQLVDLARSATHQRADSHSAPATFTPLPDDILLPFIDRPSEVAALIATPPSAKLFSLLEKTLAPITVPSSDPAKWSYPQLHDHLTQVSRQQASDATWVLQARRCIISHSELIWERVKAALGVPPELDVPPEPERGYSSSHSSCSIDTDDISDDHGRSARGHWEDWDAVMDSPVYDRRHSGPGSPLPLSLTSDHDPSAEPTSSTFLSIEPLLASSPNPHSADGGLGLDDIQERAEEEEESAADDTPTENPDKEHLIAPSQIQGLRISTTPISLSDLSNTPSPLPVPSFSPSLPKPLSPISPLPPYNYPVPTPPRSRPQLGTYAPAGPPSVFRRSGSFGSVVSMKSNDHEVDASDQRVHPTPGPLFPSNFARLSEEPTFVHGLGEGGGKKERRCSHGGSVAGYKRLSWGSSAGGQ